MSTCNVSTDRYWNFIATPLLFSVLGFGTFVLLTAGEEYLTNNKKARSITPATASEANEEYRKNTTTPAAAAPAAAPAAATAPPAAATAPPAAAATPKKTTPTTTPARPPFRRF